MSNRLRPLAVIAAALLAACVPQARTPPPMQAPPLVVSPAPPPLAADWHDWPLTPGTWRYSRDSRGSVALFGMSGADAVLTLGCDREARAIYLSRAGELEGPRTIRTTSVSRAVVFRPSGRALGYVTATMVPNEPLLDAMGFSRGRFVVEQAGTAPLVVPAWPEIERVTEDCRK